MTTVLVVEDDERVARAIARTLKGLVDVVIAPSFERAVHALETRRDLRAVLADVRLGAEHPLGGLDILEIAHAQDPFRVLAVVSGNDSPAIQARAARVCAVVVRKPFDMVALRSLAESARRHDQVRPHSSPPPASAVPSDARQREALRLAASLDLTETETRVLVALSVYRDELHRDVAERLAMSLNTLHTHTSHIARKAEKRLDAILEEIDKAVLARQRS